jgi:hypothetical protein
MSKDKNTDVPYLKLINTRDVAQEKDSHDWIDEMSDRNFIEKLRWRGIEPRSLILSLLCLSVIVTCATMLTVGAILSI